MFTCRIACTKETMKSICLYSTHYNVCIYTFLLGNKNVIRVNRFVLYWVEKQKQGPVALQAAIMPA